MVIQKNDFVEIEYIARTKEDNLLFDTTNPALAEKQGILVPGELYGPVIVCVGKRSFLRAHHWDGCIFGALPLEGKEVGKEYDVEIPPEEGFGKRNEDLIQKISKRYLREKGIFSRVGVYIPLDGHYAKVITQTQDRITVDKNHPFAGKHLVYALKINRIVTQAQEKIEALKEAWLSKECSAVLDGNTLVILTENDCSSNKMMEETCEEIKELIPEIQAVICRKTQ